MQGVHLIKIAAIVILTAFIFVYDLNTPHGMSVSLLYLIPFTLSGLFARKKFAVAFAGVTTALVIAGYFLASATRYPAYSEVHRALTVLWGWGILAGLMQRKRVLSELSGANARLKAIFDSSPNGIIVLDPEGVVLDWNRGAQQIFGYSCEEVKGHPYPLAPDEDYDAFKKDLDSALAGNTVQNVELARKCKDGKMRYLLHSHAPLRDEEGNIYGALGIYIDMTSMKEAEAEIDKLNIDIATRKGVEQEREDLAAMITHDLKSPLTAITAYTELLLNEENKLKPEDRHEMLSVIMHNGEMMTEMIDDYLTVYRSHSGKLQLHMAPEDIAGILKDLQKDFQPVAEGKGLSLKFAFAEEPRAVIDKKQFGRAVSNLVQNAIKYTPEGGKILVTLEADERDFTVSVHDTGSGIRPEERGNIFQKHYRSRMAAGTKGAGLGLSIVKAVTEAHGGQITLQSEPDLGSTFKLTIPLNRGKEGSNPYTATRSSSGL
jgi:two-component system, OmpR family, sensor histidine kinase VicK